MAIDVVLLYSCCTDVVKKLPLEFAKESEQLLTLKLEGSVG